MKRSRLDRLAQCLTGFKEYARLGKWIYADAPPATRLEPLFRILIGFIAGIALAFLVEYLDPTLRTRHQSPVRFVL